MEGANHTFTVTATGTGPLFYQWRRNSGDLIGKTNDSLALTAVQTNQAGVYSVVVTNVEGSVTSAPAMLRVRLASDPVYPTPQNGWAYVFEGASAAADLTAALDGTWNHENDSWVGDGRGAGNELAGGLSVTNGILTIEDAVTGGSGFNNRRFNFTHNVAQESGVTNASTLLNDGVTLTFRARLTPPTDPLVEITNAPNGVVNNSDGKGMFCIRQSGSSGLLIGFSLNRALEDTNTSGNFNFGQAGLHMNNLNGNVRSSLVDPGEGGTTNLLALDPTVFHEFWITIQDNGTDPGTHRVSVYLDGGTTPAVFNVTAGLGVDGPAANYLALGLGNSSAQRGALDVDFFAYKAIALAPSTFNEPVGFALQPASQFVAAGQVASFNAGVTGTPPYALQWYRDGDAISGATNSAYSTPPVVAGDEGATFVVTVANDVNSITSSPPAVLHLLNPPEITSQPQSLAVTNGDTAGFSVVASSATSPGYQWRRNGDILINETNSTLFIASASAGSAGNYDVLVSNGGGSTTSEVATLTVVLMDLGDAPDPSFPTLKASNGARHVIVAGVQLGTGIDTEVNGQPSAEAMGDDLNGTDDEDGVTFVTPLRVGQTASLEVVASTNGWLNAWVDFDRDGSWNGAGEQVFTNQALVAGTNFPTILVPATASAGAVQARFRFDTAGGLSFSGPAADGEVEDYSTTIAAVADLSVVQTDSPDPVAVHGNLTYSITVQNAGPSMATGVTLTNVVPAGVAVVSVMVSQGSCNQSAGVLTCSLGSLDNAASATVTLIVTPTSFGNITNTVGVSAVEVDLSGGNNVAVSSTVALDAPLITAQPQNQTVTNGNSANFTVTVSGAAPLHFQWRFNGAELDGETNVTLTIPNAQPINAGAYSIRITNQVGAAVSETAALTVLVPPSITAQPESRTNLAGSTATFSVEATGTGPLGYQWSFNSTNSLAGATGSLLTLSNVQLTNAGSYGVSVSNSAGVITSAVAALTVVQMDFGDAPDTYPTVLATNGARHRIVPGVHLGAMIDFEPDAQVAPAAAGDDLSGSDDEDGVTFTSPMHIGQTVNVSVVASTNGVLNAWIDFSRNGSWAEGGEQVFTDHTLTPGTNSLSFVVPAGANPGPSFARFRFNTAGGLSFTGEAGDGEVEDYLVSLEAVTDLGITRLDQIDPVTFGNNQTYTITLSNSGAFTATGVVLNDLLPVEADFVSATPDQGSCTHSAGTVLCSLGSVNPGETTTVTIVAFPNVPGRITNSASIAADQTDLNTANNAVAVIASVFVFPEIVSQPQSQTVTNGGSTSFNVVANGTALRYQWSFDGVELGGETNAVFAIGNAQPASAGSYSVRVTNEVGIIFSSPATLTVLMPITITAQPESQTVLAGSNVSFTVTATGSAPLTYQWEFNGGDLGNETSPSLILTNVQLSQGGAYRVRVGNPAGTVTSTPATLVVLLPPSFNVQPASRTNYAGTATTFVSLATGTEPLSYQWYFNQAVLLPGETNVSLTLTDLQRSQSGNYSVVATNIAGTATSATAVLTVYEVDFGDAPESRGYPTTRAFNGARHRLAPGIHLGFLSDFEADGQPSAGATDDDSDGIDDEDGVTFPSPLLIGQMVDISIVASTNGLVDAWIDFNADGTWADPSEQVLSSWSVQAGTNIVALPISASAMATNTFTRFRFSTSGGLSYDGFAEDGEVEDYAIAIQRAIDLAVSITDSSDPVNVLSTVNHTVIVTNGGPSAATGIWLTNTLPASFTILSITPSQGSCTSAGGQVVCSLGSLAVGGTATVVLSARANSAGTFSSSAVVVGNESEVRPADNARSQITSVIVPATAFTRLTSIPVADGTGSGPGIGNPYPSTIVVSGLTGTIYKVTATLHGITHSFAGDLDVLLVGPGGQSVMLMSDVGGGFVLNDVTPTFDDAADLTMPAGGVITSTSYRPTNFDPSSDSFPPPAPGSPFGSALSVFSGSDPNGTWSLHVIDDAANDTGTIGGGWRLNISTADPIADLAVSVRELSDPTALHSNLVYTVTVTNRGPAVATSIAVTNLLPSGVTFISANPGQGTCGQQAGIITCQIGGLNPGAATTLTINASPLTAGLFTNTVSAADAQIDFNAGNNTATVVTTVVPATDLSIAQFASTNLVLLGELLTYTLNVTNHGPNPANNVRVTDVLPPNVNFVSASSAQGSCAHLAGTVGCDVIGIPIGAHAQITLIIAPISVGNITNTAVVISDELDPRGTNNNSITMTMVNIAADLAVTMVDSPDPVAVSNVLSYAIVVTNLGPSTATSVQLTDPLPANVSFLSATPGQGSCTNESGTIHCVLGSILPGSSALVTVMVEPSSVGEVTNTVSISSSSADFSVGNNSAQRETTVELPPFVLTSPQSQTVTNGVNVSFFVTASGSNPLIYQWQFNDVDIPGATSANLTLINVTLAAGGSYRVRVSNNVGNAFSAAATLTVLVPPMISDIVDQQTDEDTSTAEIPFVVSDTDSPAANLGLAVFSSNATLAPTNNITLGGSGSDRTIRIAPAANQSGTVTITVQVHDGDNLTAVDSFVLTVQSVNDLPTLTDIADQTTSEDTALAVPFTIEDVETMPADLVPTAISSNPSLLAEASIVFAGTGTNRTMTLLPATNQSGIATITLMVTDTNGASVIDTFVVTVTPVNDPPTLDPLVELIINEDAGPQVVTLGNITSGAPDEVQTNSVSAASDNPMLIPHPSVIYTNADSFGTLSFTPLANAHGATTITVTVDDGGPSNNFVKRTFTVTVLSSNDSPRITGIGDVATFEDTPTGPIEFSVEDVETAAASLLLDVSSSDLNLVPLSNILLAGEGTNRTLTVIPATNQSGEVTITIGVTDDEGGTNNESFVFTVSPVNDAPGLTDVPDQIVAEDGFLSIPVTIGDAETSSTALSFTVTSSNTNLVSEAGILVEGTGSNRVVTLTPLSNEFGTTTITLTVNDGTNSTGDTFVANVSPVNDPPTLDPPGDLTIDEDAGVQVVTLSNITAGASNEAGTNNISAVSSNPALIPQLLVTYTNADTTGTLSFTPVANAHGTAVIFVSVDDGGASNNVVTQTFRVTVISSNDVPGVTDVPDQTMDEDNVLTIPVTIGDVETPASELTFTVTSSNTNLVAESGILLEGTGSNRVVALAPVLHEFGTSTITLTVSDGTNSASDTFLLTVRQVIHAPEIVIQPQSLTVTNGADVVLNVTATGTGPLFYQWKHNGADLLTQVASTLALSAVQPANAGSYTVTITNAAGSTTSAIAVLRVLEPVVITAIHHSGESTTISFMTISGLNYTIEHKDVADGEVWSPLPGVAGTGDLLTVIDPAANVPSRFYRIRTE